MFERLVPNMMVQDVQNTVKFYRDLLGFTFVMAVPKGEQGVCMEMPQDKTLIYALVKSDNIEIMFQTKESLSEDILAFKGTNIGASVSFYFYVDNISALYDGLKEKVEVVKPLHNTWYGMREFYIKDCNGYILGFSQKI